MPKKAVRFSIYIKAVFPDLNIRGLFVLLENGTTGSRETRTPTPVERRETPPRKQGTPPSKPKTSDPSANTEGVPGGKRPLARLVSGQKPAASAGYPFSRPESRDSVGSSTEDSSVVSAGVLKKKESKNLGSKNISAVQKDEILTCYERGAMKKSKCPTFFGQVLFVA